MIDRSEASTSDVVVIGAGVVGAACGYYAARAGLSVTVLDRGTVAGATTGSGEGNLLVSDKEPGPELALALRSSALWGELDREVGGFEYHRKGGLIVTADPGGRAGLTELAARQRAHGVTAEPVDPAGLAEHEPHLAPGLAGGVYYPQDAQVQPMLAAARLIEAARRRYGARFGPGTEVTGITRDGGGRVTGVTTTAGRIAAGAVVNAAGTWGADVAALAGITLPILPRRGFVLVTEPLPQLIRHKVYGADYVANVASDAAGLETSPVIESTASGTVLIGSSRERVGFDTGTSVPVLRRIAAQAIALFPVLASASVIRAYCGFRPYCPDHLPVLGPDPRAQGLYHACGHEGAGIGLAAASGRLIAGAIAGTDPPGPPPDGELHAMRPQRFEDGHD